MTTLPENERAHAMPPIETTNGLIESVRTLSLEALPSSVIFLRDDQKETVRALQLAMSNGHDRVMLHAPTGSGKTIVACALILDWIRTNPASVVCLFVVDRVELVQQTLNKMQLFGIGAKQWGTTRNTACPVVVATIQTLARQTTVLPVTHVILDEAHHAFAPMYQTLLRSYRVPLVGLTATPFRGKQQENLQHVFPLVIHAKPLEELISMGTLVPPVYYGFTLDELDVNSVQTRKGDFRLTDLARVMHTGE
jgi:superfamily II DNA or RNA helicase